MQADCELAGFKGFGNVMRFPCGRITVSVQGFSIHLMEDAFMAFVAMMNDARMSYVDRRLRDMIGDTEKG